MYKNICFVEDNKKIDEERLNDALNLSDSFSFLKNLPLGLDTIVGERGIKLSGGQRQGIALAELFTKIKK